MRGKGKGCRLLCVLKVCHCQAIRRFPAAMPTRKRIVMMTCLTRRQILRSLS